MIIPPGFYYEIQHPQAGAKAHVVIRYLPAKEAKAAGVPQQHYAQLSNLYVHPELQSRGLGKWLLTQVKGWANATQTNIVLRASPYQRTPHFDLACLKNFYEHCGFREIKGTAYHRRPYKEKVALNCRCGNQPDSDKCRAFHFNGMNRSANINPFLY